MKAIKSANKIKKQPKKRMRNLVKRNLNGRMILLLFIISNSIYLFMLAVTIPKVMRFSGGMKILDMMPVGYDSEYVNTLLSTLGEKGRNAYLYNQIPVDMIYPSLFAASSCLVLAFFLDKLDKLDGSLFYLCLLPLFSGLFDYGENIGIITILTTYPKNPILLTQITNAFSILKSLFVTIYFFALVFTLIVFGISQFFPKKEE